MQHHEELATQVAGQRRAHVLGCRRGLLVPFDLQLVPVAHEHCVDVVDEVGNGEHDVRAGQPMPVERERRYTKSFVTSKNTTFLTVCLSVRLLTKTRTSDTSIITSAVTTLKKEQLFPSAIQKISMESVSPEFKTV